MSKKYEFGYKNKDGAEFSHSFDLFSELIRHAIENKETIESIVSCTCSDKSLVEWSMGKESEEQMMYKTCRLAVSAILHDKIKLSVNDLGECYEYKN